jgi:hypothetical protein
VTCEAKVQPHRSGQASVDQRAHDVPFTTEFIPIKSSVTKGPAHPEIVQAATEFHHQITDPLLPQADPVLHDAAALDTAVDMLDPQPPLIERLVRPLLLPRQLLAAGFLGRHEDHHLRERERQEPQILQEPAPRR